MSDMSGLFTLSNHGQARNCSLTTLLFPANFDLVSVAVGGAGVGRHRRAEEVGLRSAQCDPADWVQLGGSAELSAELATSQGSAFTDSVNQ